MIKTLISLILILCLSLPVHAASWKVSWYQSGSHTASGEHFNPNGMTAAHKSLPFGTRVRITYNHRSVIVRINDRGPFVKGRDGDLSRGAARSIHCYGVCRVIAEIL